jgi:hypothetical protein
MRHFSSPPWGEWSQWRAVCCYSIEKDMHLYFTLEVVRLSSRIIPLTLDMCYISSGAVSPGIQFLNNLIFPFICWHYVIEFRTTSEYKLYCSARGGWVGVGKGSQGGSLQGGQVRSNESNILRHLLTGFRYSVCWCTWLESWIFMSQPCGNCNSSKYNFIIILTLFQLRG